MGQLNVNSETSFGSHWIVQNVDCLIYISDTDMEEEHRQHSIDHGIYIKASFTDTDLPAGPDLLAST
jgi:hypothetical protein